MYNTLDSRSPLVTSFLQGFSQRFIKNVKLFNKDLLECVAGAELIDFVAESLKYILNFGEDPSLVVLDGIVFDGLMSQVLS